MKRTLGAILAVGLYLIAFPLTVLVLWFFTSSWGESLFGETWERIVKNLFAWTMAPGLAAYASIYFSYRIVPKSEPRASAVALGAALLIFSLVTLAGALIVQPANIGTSDYVLFVYQIASALVGAYVAARVGQISEA